MTKLLARAGDRGDCQKLKRQQGADGGRFTNAEDQNTAQKIEKPAPSARCPTRGVVSGWKIITTRSTSTNSSHRGGAVTGAAPLAPRRTTTWQNATA